MINDECRLNGEVIPEGSEAKDSVVEVIDDPFTGDDEVTQPNHDDDHSDAFYEDEDPSHDGADDKDDEY